MLPLACIIAIMLLVVVYVHRRAARRQPPKNQFKRRFKRMQTRQRLQSLGLSDQFDDAVRRAHLDGAIEILVAVELDYVAARRIAESAI